MRSGDAHRRTARGRVVAKKNIKVEGIRSVAVAAPEVTTFVVSKWTIDSLLKDRKEWFVEKSEEPQMEDKPEVK